MKPLRVVRPRVEEIETQQDLRGLSDESFFRFRNPLPTLTLSSETTQLDLFSSFLKKEYPELVGTLASNTLLHVTGEHEHKENFKDDLILLYALSLSLSHVWPTTSPLSMKLWIFDQMGAHMGRAIQGLESVNSYDLLSKESSTLNPNCFLTVPEISSLYLRQAGFQGLATKGDSSLSRSDVHHLFEIEQAQVARQAPAHQRKVI